jgi:hypothetical protein
VEPPTAARRERLPSVVHGLHERWPLEVQSQPLDLPITPLNTARLTVSNVAGCAGLVLNGDHATFTVTYTLSPATLTIT